MRSFVDITTHTIKLINMNTGKLLENLVQEIERILTPADINVEINEKIFDDTGVQVAEFDIIITGKLGSSSLRWLIECRDRPSAGAAPLSWIEQLYGRRNFHNFDKVFAVSTTGFAPGAVKFANQFGIFLRTVDSVSELASDFQVLSGINVTPKIKSLNISCFTVLHYEGKSINLTNPLFRLEGEDNYRDMTDFALQNFSLPDEIDENELYQFSVFFRGPVDVYSNGDNFTFVDLGFTINTKLKVTKVQILTESMKSYEEDGKVIGQEVKTSMITPIGKLSTQYVIAHRADGTHVVKVNTSSEVAPPWILSQPRIKVYKRKDRN